MERKGMGRDPDESTHSYKDVLMRTESASCKHYFNLFEIMTSGDLRSYSYALSLKGLTDFQLCHTGQSFPNMKV